MAKNAHKASTKLQIAPLLITVFVTCLLGSVSTYLTVKVLLKYELFLFLLVPTIMAIVSTVLYSKITNTHPPLKRVPFINIAVFCLGLLAFAFEGVICIAMALPLGLVFTWIGYRIALMILKKPLSKGTSAALVALLVSSPGIAGLESKLPQKETLRSVTTAVTIHAPIETVWKNVVTFPTIAPPTETLFKIGIAYPTHAKIQGTGVGAIRTCHFSTGTFVEPITVWDQPNLLKFTVTDQPEPMTELSPYEIHPDHLHGYFVSKQGQFKLTKISESETRLEGTTWYYNRIQPNFYWVLWSDYIIHRIHNRVLDHIKIVSEHS